MSKVFHRRVVYENKKKESAKVSAVSRFTNKNKQKQNKARQNPKGNKKTKVTNCVESFVLTNIVLVSSIVLDEFQVQSDHHILFYLFFRKNAKFEIDNN